MNKDILLIEDSRSIRDSLVWVIEYEGFSVATATNGKEALDLLAQGWVPSMILLDMLMPVMNGWEFRELQQKNALWKNIPTVILTASVNMDKNIPLYKNEFYIPKPFDVNELLALVKKFCLCAELPLLMRTV